MPPRSNNFTIDGANMGNQYATGPNSISGTTLGVDGIKEYKIITSMFGAEYGMEMGSQMVIVSKGGSNTVAWRRFRVSAQQPPGCAELL